MSDTQISDQLEIINRFNNGLGGAGVIVISFDEVEREVGPGQLDFFTVPEQHSALLTPEQCRQAALKLLENSVRPGALSVIRDLIRENPSK